MKNNNKNSLYWKIATKYNIKEILRQNPKLTIQGEQGNTKVQGNKYKIADEKMWVFNIINHVTGYHFDYSEMRDFCEKYNLDIVPLLEQNDLKNIGKTQQEIIEYSKGRSLLNKNIHREGVVIHCIQNGQKIFSFKAINPDFLLKYD